MDNGKNISAQKITSTEDKPRTSCVLIWCPHDSDNLALHLRLRLLRSLYDLALLMLTESFISKSQLVQRKLNLNITQLTLNKLAQSARHESRTQEVPGSIPTFLQNYFALPFITIYCQHCQLCIIMEKLQRFLIHTFFHLLAKFNSIQMFCLSI